MTTHEEIRLEKNGVVVAYFAPNFQVTPIDAHDLKPFILPRGRGTRAKDLQMWRGEITIQGEFEHSDNLPTAHRNALTTLFGHSPVTAMEQVNRIRHFARTTTGTYDLFVGENSYNANTSDDVDIENGVFPPVFIMEIRPPRTSGLTRVNYMVQFLEGFQI